MAESLSEKEALQVIGQVKHPAIDHTLVDLGMIRDIVVEGQSVTLTFVFPFAGIPIKEMLIDSVRQPLEKMGAEVDVSEVVMDQEELQKFLAMEKEGWKGGL